MTAKRLVLAILTKLVVTVTFLFGMAGVAVASAYVTTARTGIVQERWEVSVGAPSRTLYPGVAVSLPYEVRNGASHRQVLHATTATIKKVENSVCSAESFVATAAISAMNLPADVEPGATLHGAVTLVFAEHSSQDDACEGVVVQIVVTAN